MTEQPVSMPPVKLGLAVAWPAFWTGVPIKVALVLLLLAAGVHPWEEAGLAVLLLLSIPVDIWAVGLSARTVFLERLRLEPPDGIGPALWWRGMLLTAIYFPLAFYIQSQTKAVSKSVATGIMDLELLKHIPIAERISIELTLWGTVASAMLLALVLGWLFLFGRIVRGQAVAARPTDAPYEVLIRRWDLLRVPSDQPLLLTAVVASGVLAVLIFWGLIPATTPHPHELYKKDTVKMAPALKPVDALQKTEKVLAQAEVAVQALEEKKVQEEAEQKKGKGKGRDKAKAPAKDEAAAKSDASKATKAGAAKP